MAKYGRNSSTKIASGKNWSIIFIVFRTYCTKKATLGLVLCELMGIPLPPVRFSQIVLWAVNYRIFR